MSKYPTSSRQYPYFSKKVGQKLTGHGWYFWWFGGSNLTTDEFAARSVFAILKMGKLQPNMYRVINPGVHQHRYCVVYKPVNPINYP